MFQFFLFETELQSGSFTFIAAIWNVFQNICACLLYLFFLLPLQYLCGFDNMANFTSDTGGHGMTAETKHGGSYHT